MIPIAAPVPSMDNMPPRVRAAFQAIEHIRAVRYVEFYSGGSDRLNSCEHALSVCENGLYLTAMDTIRQYVGGELTFDELSAPSSVHRIDSDNDGGTVVNVT